MGFFDSLTDFSSGMQGVRGALMQRAAAQAAEQEKIRQFQARLGLDEGRLGLDAEKLAVDDRQHTERLGFDRDKLNLDDTHFQAQAPEREARTGFIRTQTRDLEQKPLYAEQARQAQEARDKTQHQNRLSEIGAQGALRAPKAENRMWVIREGKPVFVGEGEVQPGDLPNNTREQGRPSLGAEKTALGYFNRMLQAEKDARAVEKETGNWDAALSGGIPLLPEFAENALKTGPGQKYTQAQRAYTEARLRKESGAAINKDEYENDRRMSFRNVGDKDDTLAQKRAQRLTTLRGLGTQAGRALQEHYGDTANLDELLKEFAEQDAGGAKPIVQRNARTGQTRISQDGGKTWQVQ